MSKLNSALYDAPTDQLGKKIEFDVREDDEKPKKMQEILELLVAAGYFRARIKGLSEFDKIVGGLTWCITTCNYDVDVDLLFQENLNIGLKIALTERIVAVLPRMKCPFAIEPHQIQGLDFVHIFPVVQWLVKKAIETREEFGDMNRAYAISQFEKFVKADKDDLVELKTVKYLKEINAPQRKYVRKDAQRIQDKAVRIQSTLLEYGHKTYLTKASAEAISSNQSSTNKAAMSLKQTQEQQEQQLNAAKQAEEEQIKKMISGMAADSQKTRLNASVVGQIIGLQQDELQEIVSFYTNKDNELQQTLDQLGELGDSGGGAHKQRLINVLNKQIEQREISLTEKKAEIENLENELEKSKDKLNELKSISDERNKEIKSLEDLNNSADTRVIKKLEEYIVIYDAQKVKENEYKKKCKDELAALKLEIEGIKNNNDNTLSAEDNEKYEAVIDQYNNFKTKIHGVRLKLAKKNREISLLQRRLDEIPSRTELSQYQKRFIELYNQISAVHTQTKQFFILYNGLEDKKVYMNKEISLLNSINEQFVRAMSSQNTREQFLKQLETIVEGIMQGLQKTENRKTEQKTKRDTLNDKYIDLIDKKRIYYKTVKDFQEECKKNEMIASKLQE